MSPHTSRAQTCFVVNLLFVSKHHSSAVCCPIVANDESGFCRVARSRAEQNERARHALRGPEGHTAEPHSCSIGITTLQLLCVAAYGPARWTGEGMDVEVRSLRQ